MPGRAPWTARDWRQFTALTLLALAAVPLTAIIAAALLIVYQQPGNHYAFWLGQAAAGLILVDLLGLSAILGRRTFRLKAGSNEIEATGEDGERVLAHGDAA